MLGVRTGRRASLFSGLRIAPFPTHTNREESVARSRLRAVGPDEMDGILAAPGVRADAPSAGRPHSRTATGTWPTASAGSSPRSSTSTNDHGITTHPAHPGATGDSDRTSAARHHSARNRFSVYLWNRR